MKNHLLSFIAIVLLYSCNNPSTNADSKLFPVDSMGVTLSSPSPEKVVPTIGSGLTMEEMRDDSTFLDGSIPVSWENAGITDVKGFKLFLKKIQQLVLHDEKDHLSAHIRYPLGRSIKTPGDFIKNYDNLFTKDVKLSMANINFSQVFRNSKGVMTDGGRVWFAQFGEEFKIIAINN